MADNANLTIGIGADTSKLRADLAIAQAEVRKFGTDLRKAATGSLATGDTAAVAGIEDIDEMPVHRDADREPAAGSHLLHAVQPVAMGPEDRHRVAACIDGVEQAVPGVVGQ